jgi:3-deoxy-D-manno-octulosonic-acid transferase
LALRPAWRSGLSERLGLLEPAKPAGIWVHGASVGEVLAAAPLVERLVGGGCPTFASATTVSGRDLLRRILPDVASGLAPVDHPWCVEAALGRIAPKALVLVETELWPVWIAAARRRGIAVVVVSGRISDRSFSRYRRLRPLLAPTLRRIDLVGARSPRDAERFATLGARPEQIRVTGDLKLELPEDASRFHRLAPDLSEVLSSASFFVAGSTHPGEEAAALEALEACERGGLQLSLVLAPRALGRVDGVERELREAGRRVRRRSAPGGGPLAPGEVLLLDSLGELRSVFAAARAAFVGGTLVPVGGHNLLEPVLAGCPVLFGPHLAAVRESADLLLGCGAGQAVADRAGLARALVELLCDPESARARAERGRRALQEHRGSLGRSLDLIQEACARRESCSERGS